MLIVWETSEKRRDGELGFVWILSSFRSGELRGKAQREVSPSSVVSEVAKTEIVRCAHHVGFAHDRLPRTFCFKNCEHSFSGKVFVVSFQSTKDGSLSNQQELFCGDFTLRSVVTRRA